MSEFVRVHCRFCEQMFFTNPDAQKCDLCGKVGGLTDPAPILAAKAQAGIEAAKAEEERKRAQQQLIDANIRHDALDAVWWAGLVCTIAPVALPLLLFLTDSMEKWSWWFLGVLPVGVALLFAARWLEGAWTGPTTSSERRIDKRRAE